MTIKLLDLYKSVLATASFKVTSDGIVKVALGKNEKPMTIKGKTLVLPTDDHLKNPDWDKRIVFHPLYENIMRAESDVLVAFRQALNLKINFVIGTLAHDYLMTWATSTAEHAKMNPDQSEFLSKVKQADEKTLEILNKLLDIAPAAQSQKSFVHLYLKKTGTVQGKRYSRVGVVSFPLYQELKSAPKDHVYFGTKIPGMRVKDREALIALLEYMFPGIDEAEAYNRGSSSEVAPSLDALMHAVAAVADPLNSIIDLFANLLGEETVQQLRFEDSWLESFDNLGALVPQIRAIPMLPGNEGATKASDTPAAPTTPVQPAQPAQPQFAAAPAPAPQPAPPHQPSWQPPQPQMQPPMYPQQPMYPGAPVYGAPGYPQPGYPQPGYPQQPPQAPQVKTADGKLNFDALMAADPRVGGAVFQNIGQFGGAMLPVGGYPGAGAPPMERQPRWAAPQYPQQGGYPQQGYPQQGYNPGYGGGGRF